MPDNLQTVHFIDEKKVSHGLTSEIAPFLTHIMRSTEVPVMSAPVSLEYEEEDGTKRKIVGTVVHHFKRIDFREKKPVVVVYVTIRTFQLT